MSGSKVVLITGASGSLGSKSRRHLQGRHTLRLLDRRPKSKLPIRAKATQSFDRWLLPVSAWFTRVDAFLTVKAFAQRMTKNRLW